MERTARSVPQAGPSSRFRRHQHLLRRACIITLDIIWLANTRDGAPIKGASCRPGASLQRRGFAHRIRTSNYLALASGFVIARAVSTNNSASGLSVRFFNVMIAIVPRALANSTGNALSEGCLLGSINV